MYHGCIKPGFTSNNYSIDRAINFYSKATYLWTQYAWFAFCHAFRMSVTYEIAHNNFDVIFLPDSSEKLSCFGCKLFCNENIFQIICLDYEIPKTSTFYRLKGKRVSS